MPIDYKKYPPNWKTEIRPAILQRAGNCCEQCKVPNGEHVFRGTLQNGREVYQDADGRVYDANDGKLLFRDVFAYIRPSTGDPNQLAIRIVLTIAHVDHDVTNNDYSNLRAWCQQCHNRHDAKYRAQNRKQNRKNNQPSLFGN